MTPITIKSDILSNVFPYKSNITNLVYPSRLFIILDNPNPNKKLKSCPENIPEIAVEA